MYPFLIPMVMTSLSQIRLFLLKKNICSAPLTSTSDVSLTGAILEGIVEKPDLCLNCFCPLEVFELAGIIASFDQSTCLLDPIPKYFSSINISMLDAANPSLLDRLCTLGF